MTRTTVRVALASVPPPRDRDDAVAHASRAIREAATAGAAIVAFPECYVPGYRGAGSSVVAPDAAYLEVAWATLGATAAAARITVVLGTERVGPMGPIPTVLVVDDSGARVGFCDKTQLDPSEHSSYAEGDERRVFAVGDCTFGVAICHEGFRYPETVRWAALAGAQLVFHPHYACFEAGGYRPSALGDPANSFHESSARCRAAENEIFYASVNYATDGAPTTTLIAAPDGSVLAHLPYGHGGLLVADLDLAQATGRLAARYRPLDPAGRAAPRASPSRTGTTE